MHFLSKTGISSTINQYTWSIPYLVEEKGLGYHVDVDVFAVSDSQLASIDALEGHPRWYQRKEIYVKTLGGKKLKVWIYFNPKTDTYNKQFRKTY